MPSLLALYILLVFVSRYGGCTLREFQLNVEIEQLSAAASRTIHHFYSDRASALSLIRSAMQPFTYYKQSEIINRVLLRTKSTIAYVVEEPKFMKFSPFLRSNAILFFDGYESFRQFHNEITTKNIHNAGFYTIILTEYVEQAKITQIFNDCWKYRMVNVNVLRFDQIKEHVNVYTYFPYTPNHCEQIQSTFLMTVDNRSNESLTKHIMFPNKLRNFQGCPLWLATYTIPPYMILQPSNGTYITRGIEGKLYRELGATLNFRPLVRVGFENYLGGAKENFHMLRKREVNFTMFAIVNTVERSKEFTASFPYSYASVVFTVPHGPPFTPLEKLVLPFEPYVWLCIVIVTGAAFTLIVCMKCCPKQSRDFVLGGKNHAPFLNYINVTLGGVVTQPPTRNFARTIFMIWMLGSMILRSSYQGALFSFIQSQQSAVEINSLEKLVQYNFSIYSSEQIIRLLKIGSPHLNLKLHDGSFDIMEALKVPGSHGSFVTTLDIIGYHNHLFHKTGAIRPSKQRIFLLPLSIFMQKHSCLESIINHQIELFSMNGLIGKWSNIFREKLITARKRPRESPKKLKLVEVSGAYELCSFLYGMSTLLFIAEVISVKFHYLRKLFDHV